MADERSRRTQMDIEHLKTPQSAEIKAFATFASGLLTGLDVGGRYLQLQTNNRPTSSNDKAKFKIDARLTLDGEPIGVLDVERKPEWKGGGWPYQRINIPYRPADCFFQGKHGAGRLSSKMRELYRAWKTGSPGFWVAYTCQTADPSGQQMMMNRQGCMIVPAEHIFGTQFSPRIVPQPTRYKREDGSQIFVDVVALPIEAGIICFSENDFTTVIVDAVSTWLQQQEVKA